MTFSPGLRELVDDHFPERGPCAFCGETVLGARHRVIDAMAERVTAGEPPDEVAGDFDVTVDAVAVAVAASYELVRAGRAERRRARKEAKEASS